MTEEFLKDLFLADYTPTETLLRNHGLTFLQAEQEQTSFCEKFHRLAGSHRLRTDSLLHFCTDFLEYPETAEITEELRFLYLSAVMDCGLLFPDDPSERTREQNVRCYLEQTERMTQFSRWLDAQKSLMRIFAALHTAPKPEHSTPEMTLNAEYAEILRLSLQQKSLRSGRDNPIFAENLMELMRQVNASPYRSVRLFVYAAVLSQRQKLMLTRTGYSPNLGSVFHYKNYQIEQDNEKNYASYTESVRLYMRFREYLKKAAESDIPLSDHCFAVCSNLSEWYYFHADMEDLPIPCGVYSKMRELLPCSFPCLPDAPEQEDWLEEAMLRRGERMFAIL